MDTMPPVSDGASPRPIRCCHVVLRLLSARASGVMLDGPSRPAWYKCSITINTPTTCTRDRIQRGNHLYCTLVIIPRPLFLICCGIRQL